MTDSDGVVSQSKVFCWLHICKVHVYIDKVHIHAHTLIIYIYIHMCVCVHICGYICGYIGFMSITMESEKRIYSLISPCMRIVQRSTMCYNIFINNTYIVYIYMYIWAYIDIYVYNQ